MTLKNGFGKCSLFCYISQWMKRSKHELPAKENPNMEKELFDWCCSMTSKWSIDWFVKSSLGMKFFQLSVRLTNQKPNAILSLRQADQINLFPFVCAFSFQGHTKITLISLLTEISCKEHSMCSRGPLSVLQTLRCSIDSKSLIASWKLL